MRTAWTTWGSVTIWPKKLVATSRYLSDTELKRRSVLKKYEAKLKSLY